MSRLIRIIGGRSSKSCPRLAMNSKEVGKVRFWLIALLAVEMLAGVAQAANPPFCPHVIGFTTPIENWAATAPWVKVLYWKDIIIAKNHGCKVFYRPYEIPNRDDGGCGDGIGMANNVLALLANVPTSQWPDAIGYRNEFDGTDTTTTQQFTNYYNTLRAGGYNGMIVFGSYSTGVPESYRWSEPDVVNAVNRADAIETHEYFDLTEAFCHTWLACRHVRFINENPYLLGKPWFIGEAGSDRITGGCHEDPCSRRGWKYYDCGAQKLTEQQYINELSTYRSLCANQVVAVFIFQQGDGNWADFDVMGTSVATWMQSTWSAPPSTGTIAGNVKNTSSQNLSGATVTTSPGSYSATTDSSGNYTISNVLTGTYSVTAAKSGYSSSTQTGKAVTAGQTTTVNFILTPVSGTEMLTNGSFNNGCTGWSHSESPTNIYWGCGYKAYPGTSSGAGGHSWNAYLSCGGYWCDRAFTAEQHQDNVPVTAGANYTASAKVYYEPVKYSGVAGDQKERLVLIFNNGTTINGNWLTHTAANGWNEIALSGTVPTGASSMTFKVEMSHVDSQWSGTGAVDECSFISQAGSCTAPTITTQPQSQTKNLGQSVTFSVTASGTAPLGYQWKKNGANISGATSSSYTISSVSGSDAGSYTCYVSNSCGNVTSDAATLTVYPAAAEDFTSMPGWSSSFDAAWGNAANWSIVSGGQSGNFLQCSRTGQGSSAKVKVYTVPANKTLTISLYMRCPNYGGSYWMESAYRLGNHSAQDFDQNSGSWTLIRKFANSGYPNGNGNVWTRYSVTVNTGSDTQISIGYKLGASGNNGPTVGWDTFRIE